MKPIDVIGDYKGFFSQQYARLKDLNINITGRAISHLAYRTATVDEYIIKRDALEQIGLANVENVWNGRPISKLLLKDSLDLGDQFSTRLIELIPPKRRDDCKQGLEHVGVVMGEDIEGFWSQHRAALSIQQQKSATSDPYVVHFDEDQTMVKFYRHSLQKICEIDGHVFDDFYHTDNS